MGAYLSEPVTTKESEDGEGNRLKYGASSMQGWRVSQEDSHNCVGEFDKNSSLFGVYDGHGGAEVAIYLSKHLPEFLKKNPEYASGSDLKKALIGTYLSIDQSIKSKEALTEIQLIAKGKNDQDEVAGVDFEDENVCALYEEATMPLEALVAKYHSEQGVAAPEEANAEERPCSSKSILSPKLPKRKPDQIAPVPADKLPAEAEISTNGDGDSHLNVSNEADQVDIKAKNENDDIINSSSELKNEEEKIAKIEHKNGESDIKANKDVDGTKDDKTIVSAVKQHINGEHHEEIKKVEFVSGGSLKAENSEIQAAGDSPEKESGGASGASSASSGAGRVKRANIYQSLITPMDSDSDADPSESDEDDSFHIPKMNIGDDDSSDEEIMYSGSSDENDVLEDEEESEEDDEEEDDEFLNDSQEPGFDSGSTAVVALLRWEADLLHVFVANAGDSRCVVSRDGKALDMSKDHKPEEEVEAKRIVRAGGKVTADGRVNGGLNLSRALGDHSYKQNTTLTPEEQMITPLPDVEHVVLNPTSDDFIILACDGIWNSMTSQQVVDFVSKRLATETKLSEICEQLFDNCLAKDTTGDGTGCDNMTAVIIRLEKAKTGKRELSFVENEEEPKRVKLDTEEEIQASN